MGCPPPCWIQCLRHTHRMRANQCSWVTLQRTFWNAVATRVQTWRKAIRTRLSCATWHVRSIMISNRARLYLALALAIPLTSWSYLKYTGSNYIVCSNSQKIYTVDDSIPNAACISIRNTHIVAVGGLGNHSSLTVTAFLPDTLHKTTL